MTLRATARLQLHADFPLDAARAQLDYLSALGISHLYLSPITQARPGSAHGYDVLDPTRVSTELGGEAAFERLAEAVRARKMGLILDIVPNHMAADARNPWWREVLRQGRDSAYSAFFDVDWSAYAGKILLPILGQPYGQALRDGEIRFDEQHGEPVILAGGQALPIGGEPDAIAMLRDAGSDTTRRADLLHALLEQQHYQLAWWRAAADQLNWRRFFEVSELIGIRVEDPTVFNATHALPLSLYQRGMIDGLRIDHVDGLAEPGAYLRHLRAAMREAAPEREPYIVVEKILAPQEAIDPRWPIEGTSGYDFMDDVSALLHNPAARRPLLDCWHQHGGNDAPLMSQLQHIRGQLLGRNLVSERQTVLATWSQLIAAPPEDIPAWDRVISAWLAAFPVYRSYAEDQGPSPADHIQWDLATRTARHLLEDADHPRLVQFVTWLRTPPAPDGRNALKRLQQVTPALAAKSLEDTLYYRHGALLSRNEVGAWPQRYALGPQGFHASNLWRARHTPTTLLATATHDHKRGEDTRARLAVLTEIPDLWAERAAQWLALLPDGLLSRPDRYMLLQTLVGAWPAHWSADVDQLNRTHVGEWFTRISAWQRKALREAKQHTSWTDPNGDYEIAAQACLDSVNPTARGDAQRFRALADLARLLIEPGHINSLAQTLLRNTAPGVPDLYQGTELWDYSLVDPDNRRPVDYVQRRTLLNSGIAAQTQVSDWQTGAVKLHVIHTALQLRASCPSIFEGGYHPLYATGPRAGHVVAFMRGSGESAALVVVPRLCAWRIADYARGKQDAARAFWEGTMLRLPTDNGVVWRDLFGQRDLPVSPTGEISLANLFDHWPVALATTLAGPP